MFALLIRTLVVVYTIFLRLQFIFGGNIFKDTEKACCYQINENVENQPS